MLVTIFYMEIILVTPKEGTLQIPWPGIGPKLLSKESSCCSSDQRIVRDKQVQGGNITCNGEHVMNEESCGWPRSGHTG